VGYASRARTRFVGTRISEWAYQILEARARERGVSLYDYVREVLEEVAGTTPSEGPSPSLEERLRAIEKRLEFVEKFLEDVLCLKAEKGEARGEAREARAEAEVKVRAEEPEEPKEVKEVRKERKPKRGVFKVITTGWIRTRAGKEPEEFMKEWEEMGCTAALLPGGDKVLVVSDDVIEETIAKLNEVGARLGQLSELQDGELRERATNLSLASLIYFDATRNEWRRA